MKNRTAFLLIAAAFCWVLSISLISCNDNNEGSITVTNSGEPTGDTTDPTEDDPVDTTPPTVVSISPSQGSSEVSINTPVTVRFSEFMDPTTITYYSDYSCSGSFQLTADDFASCLPIDGSTNVSDATSSGFSFEPKNILGLSGYYKAKVTTVAADLAGNAMAEDFVTSPGFSTPDISSWLMVDGAGPNGRNKDDNMAVEYINLTAADGKLYASWEERIPPAGQYQIRVAVFNGDDSAPSWNFVEGGDLTTGINYDPSSDGWYPKGISFNSKLYMTWCEDSIFQVRVAVYDGNDASPAWTYVEGVIPATNGLNYDPSRIAYYPSFGIADGRLYLIWAERNASSINQIRVAVFNGDNSSPSWNFVDGSLANGINKDTANAATLPRIIGFNSKLYAIWMEESSVYQIRVAVYNGNDAFPAWNFVDGNGTLGINHDTAVAAWYPHLAVYANKLYATWNENGRIRVKVYNGDDSAPAWNYVDGGSNDGINYEPTASAGKPELTVLNTRLYATWIEGSRTRVAVYNGNDSTPQWSFTEKAVIDVDGINFDNTMPSYESHLTRLNSKLYAAWSEYNASNIRQIRIAVGQ